MKSFFKTLINGILTYIEEIKTKIESDLNKVSYRAYEAQSLANSAQVIANEAQQTADEAQEIAHEAGDSATYATNNINKLQFYKHDPIYIGMIPQYKRILNYNKRNISNCPYIAIDQVSNKIIFYPGIFVSLNKVHAKLNDEYLYYTQPYATSTWINSAGYKQFTYSQYPLAEEDQNLWLRTLSYSIFNNDTVYTYTYDDSGAYEISKDAAEDFIRINGIGLKIVDELPGNPLTNVIYLTPEE